MPRIAIYARKSSESDDRQAKSIEEQLAWARGKCAELGEVRPLIFQEARSARRPGRREFNRLMEAVWSGDVDKIVTWKADRLARNPSDSGAVQQALMEGKVIIVTSDRPYAEADDQFMLNLEFGFSTKYSQDLSKNVLRGLKNKLDNGEWAGLAPIGYINVSGERERRLRGGAIVIDPATAPRIKQLFRLCESGNHSLRDLTELATRQWHLHFRRTGDKRPEGRYPLATIERILKNPFYYGVLRVKGRIFPGAHEPLISKMAFDRVQRILAGRRVSAERPSKHTFPFSSLIVCSYCGHRFTAYTVRKPSGRAYTYYRCAMGSKGCTQPHVNEREILNVTTPILKQVTLTANERDRCIDVIREVTQEDKHGVVSELDQLRREHALLLRKQGRILDLFVAGELSSDEKRTLLAENDEQRTALELQMRTTTHGKGDWIEPAKDFFARLTDAETIFMAADPDEQRALLRAFQIELRAAPDKLHLYAGKAATMMLKRGDRPVGRALVDSVLTLLRSDSSERELIGTLMRNHRRRVA